MIDPPSAIEVQEIVDVVQCWGKENFRDFPWRRPRRRWHGLIAEILLQRTRAENVIPVYRAFIASFPTLKRFAEASVEEIEQIIWPLGLRWRAPLLEALGRQLYERGRVPTTIDELASLPGVGQYVAASWLSLHGGSRGVLIDSNVVRWICRMLGREFDGETRRKKWLFEIADQLTPHEKVRDFSYAVLDFTMTICIPHAPRCEICPVGPRLCTYGGQKQEALAE